MTDEARASLIAHLKNTKAQDQDRETHHIKAEQLLMACLDSELRAAWEEAQGGWWYA